MLAPIARFLLPMWETCTESQSPGFGLALAGIWGVNLQLDDFILSNKLETKNAYEDGYNQALAATAGKSKQTESGDHSLLRLACRSCWGL